MKCIFHFLLILLAFRGTDLVSSTLFEDEKEELKQLSPLQMLYDYKNFQHIKSIYAVLEKARERQQILKCKSSDVLVCLDVDLFSVRTNGGCDPLEECTVEVYQTLLQEGFKVLRLTARGHGLYIPNESTEAGALRQLNNDLVKALGDTSIGFSCDDFRMTLDFPSEGFTQYGYYLQGTLFAGPYKAYMLGGFLQAIRYVPKVIIMGDDNPGYLFGFLRHKDLIESVEGEIHLLHMPAETHISMTFGDFLKSLPESNLLEFLDDEVLLNEEEDLSESDTSDSLSPPDYFFEEEESESQSFFSYAGMFFSKVREAFLEGLSFCFGHSG